MVAQGNGATRTGRLTLASPAVLLKNALGFTLAASSIPATTRLTWISLSAIVIGALALAAWVSVPQILPTSALHQRLSETPSPFMLGVRVRYLVLPEFHLEVQQFAAQGMEWSTVIHRRVQIVRLVVPHRHVAQPAKSSEHSVG